MDLFVYSPVASATHDMHLDAIASYGKEAGMAASTHSGRPRWRDLFGASSRQILVQSTGLWNVVAMPFFRARSGEITYYLHEPSALRSKLSEGNGLVKSIVWHMVQQFDVRLASTVIVSRQELKDRAVDVYGMPPDKIRLAPLLTPPPIGTRSAQRPRVTYLGRLDDRRYLQEFLTLAPRFDDRGFQPTILTSDHNAIETLNIPSSIDVFAERNFSESMKADILNSTSVVWNPKSYAIAQSGVTVDALRYGCQIVLTEGDPECNWLESTGIAIRFDGDDVVDLINLDMCEEVHAEARRIFAERHGEMAFTTHYLPLLEIESGTRS